MSISKEANILAIHIVQEREQNETEQQFTLQRFVPLLRDVVEDLVDGKLPESEYVSVSAPKADVKAGEQPRCIGHPESIKSCMVGRTVFVMIPAIFCRCACWHKGGVSAQQP